MLDFIGSNRVKINGHGQHPDNFVLAAHGRTNFGIIIAKGEQVCHGCSGEIRHTTAICNAARRQSEKFDIITMTRTNRRTIMATAIKAIPTLKGREAREFLRHAEEVERKYATMSERDEHPLCKMAHVILVKSGMLK